MKKYLAFLFATTLVLGTVRASWALTIDATVTADNHYGLYVGGENSVSTFIGRNELGPTGSPGTYNWSQPESFVFDVNHGDYLYLASWSDDKVAQGLLGQFAISGGPTILTNSQWEYCLTFEDLDDGDSAPSLANISSNVSSATWSAVTNYLDNGSDPWGTVSGISTDADWIWGSALIPGSDYGEYQIFRLKVEADPVPEPATIFLLGFGLIGLVVSKKRKQS